MTAVVAILRSLGEQGLSFRVGPFSGEAKGIVAITGLIFISWLYFG